MTITPLHAVTDDNKVADIADSMRKQGWVGRPILVLSSGHALTGTHRIAAAELAGIDPDVYEIDVPPFGGDYESLELWGSLLEGDDLGRIAAMQALVERGELEREALDIMQEED